MDEVLACIAVAFCASACASERAQNVEPCVSWRGDLEAKLAQACGDCHGPDSPGGPAGGYDLTEYLGALGNGTDDLPNAIAGEPASLVVAYLEPETADDVHAPLSALAPEVRRWVVDCQLAYVVGGVHVGGIMNPADPDFHGALLEGLGWSFSVCADCHGEDFGGGTANAPCTSCHPTGPTDCVTCHGQVPDSGAHRAHVEGDVLSRPIDCALCHIVPVNYADAGHLFAADGSMGLDPPPAEVVFSGLAAVQLEGAQPPRYDPETATCTGVYCHGGGFDDVRASNTAPVWTATGEDQAGCGTCHGLAPASHADDRCAACHPTVADADGTIVSAALHVDGEIALGRAGEACDSCHGPPPDLAGNTSPAVLTVGAHASHVSAAHGLRGPIPCGDCHVEPEALMSPGHIDSAGPAEVFPAGFGGLAAAGGAMPVWDRGVGTCADVYCHGGGTTRLADDVAPGLRRTPRWTAVGEDEAACGACHGAPPQDGLHDPGLPLSACAGCHPATVDEFGNIRLTGPPGGQTSAHINGTIDL